MKHDVRFKSPHQKEVDRQSLHSRIYLLIGLILMTSIMFLDWFGAFR